MQVFLTTAGDFSWSRVILAEFVALAARDKMRQHFLAPDAQSADIILFVDLHQQPGGLLMPLLHRHPLMRQFPQKIRVYDERDRPWATFPGLYTSARRSKFDPRRQRSCPYIRLHNALPAPENNTPDLLFSFQGARTHACRDAVLALRHPRARIEETSHLDFFATSTDAALETAKNRYAQTLQRSKFVLCPRGHGPSSFRLFETLAAGRVPVIISDEWVPPRGPNWENCSLRVPQNQVKFVVDKIEKQENNFPNLSLNALQTYQQWFAPDILWHRLISWCEELAQPSGMKNFYQLDRFYLRALMEQLK